MPEYGSQPFDNQPYTYQRALRQDTAFGWSSNRGTSWPCTHRDWQHYTYVHPNSTATHAVEPQYYCNQQHPIGYCTHHQYAQFAPIYPHHQHHDYQERTVTEVDQDNQAIAVREGAYDAHEIAPKDPKPDQMFWCREVDGSWTLRTVFTIENDLRPGRWQVDAQRGYLVFIRAQKKN